LFIGMAKSIKELKELDSRVRVCGRCGITTTTAMETLRTSNNRLSTTDDYASIRAETRPPTPRAGRSSTTRRTNRSRCRVNSAVCRALKNVKLSDLTGAPSIVVPSILRELIGIYILNANFRSIRHNRRSPRLSRCSFLHGRMNRRSRKRSVHRGVICR